MPRKRIRTKPKDGAIYIHEKAMQRIDAERAVEKHRVRRRERFIPVPGLRLMVGVPHDADAETIKRIVRKYTQRNSNLTNNDL